MSFTMFPFAGKAGAHRCPRLPPTPTPSCSRGPRSGSAECPSSSLPRGHPLPRCTWRRRGSERALRISWLLFRQALSARVRPALLTHEHLVPTVEGHKERIGLSLHFFCEEEVPQGPRS